MENIKNSDVVRASNILDLQCYNYVTGNKIGKIIDINFNPQKGKIEIIIFKIEKPIKNKNKIDTSFNKITATGDVCLIEFDFEN